MSAFGAEIELRSGQNTRPLSIAVIGAGISGLSAAWLLSKTHRVTLYEKDARLGGHANTISACLGGASVPVDTGFIVYNEANYPNFTALLSHLGVETHNSDMSFAVSLDNGRVEYSSNDWASFVGHGRNLLSPRFCSMSLDLVRFYRRAPHEISDADDRLTLGAYLHARRYGQAFQRDHLLPMAAAIWSSSVDYMRDYPARAFIRFFENHGLLRFVRRPAWRTIAGGSKTYVNALRARLSAHVFSARAALAVTPTGAGVDVRDEIGATANYDRVLIATHADEALALLPQADRDQRRLLNAIPYRLNTAVLHTDSTLMPQRKHVWSSWNYVGDGDGGAGCAVTYWMNRLQRLDTTQPVFVTLNPARAPARESVLWEGVYAHPSFTPEGLHAQRALWSIQGRGGIWFAGAWLGSGFHEDGVQAGLAAAEQMGAVRRPWRVENESGRVFVTGPGAPEAQPEAA